MLRHPSLFQSLVLGYFFLFSLYWLVSFVWMFPSLYWAWRMKSFFRDQLHITTRTLQTMQWCVCVVSHPPQQQHHPHHVEPVASHHSTALCLFSGARLWTRLTRSTAVVATVSK